MSITKLFLKRQKNNPIPLTPQTFKQKGPET